MRDAEKRLFFLLWEAISLRVATDYYIIRLRIAKAENVGYNDFVCYACSNSQHKLYGGTLKWH